MSSAVVSTSAAHGRPFLFDDESRPEVGSPTTPGCRAALDRKATTPLGESENSFCHNGFQSTIKNQQSKILPSSVTPASRLAVRPALEMASSGIPALDALTGGLPRGCLTEICGPASSGRTTVLLAALAAATRRGEYCALIDASDALDPRSLDAAGLELDRLLWVRCGDYASSKSRNNKASRAVSNATNQTSEDRLEQVLRATDLLLESGGFGLTILDLADVPPQSARRIPLTTWFRFRRAVEHKPTILLAIEQQAIAGSCSSLLLQLGVRSTQYSVLSSNQKFTDQVADTKQDTIQDLQPAHTQLLTGLEIHVELIRSRLDRKPSRSVIFETKTAWAG